MFVLFPSHGSLLDFLLLGCSPPPVAQEEIAELPILPQG